MVLAFQQTISLSLAKSGRMKEIAGKVQETKDKLTSELGRVPGVDEVAAATGFTPEQIMQAMESAKAYGTYSLESAGLGNDEEDTGSMLEKYIGFEDTGYERIVQEYVAELEQQATLFHADLFYRNHADIDQDMQKAS